MVSDEMVKANAGLISQIEALLALDERGALAPHGIGGLARDLFKSTLTALAAVPEGEPVAWRYRWKGVSGEWSSWIVSELDPNDWTWPFYWKDLETHPLYTHPAPRPDMERELAEARAKLVAKDDELVRRVDHWSELYGAAHRLASAAQAERDALAADKARLAESVHDAESLLSVIAEDAQKAGDIATWSMASVMAEKLRAALSGASIPAPWQTIDNEPKDGTHIYAIYDGDFSAEPDEVYWQAEGRCCMLGSRAGSFPPGWTSLVAGNLPVDPPSHWCFDLHAPADKCATCNGHGLIGGLVPWGDGQVDSDCEPCPDCSPAPADKAEARREALEALSRSPAIEELTPTSLDWDKCETVRDRYDLMRKNLRSAFALISTPARREGE